MTQQPTVERSIAPSTLASWRLTGIILLRIVFGIIWTVDAWFSWQPNLINNFMNYLTENASGQPPAVQS